MRKVIVALISAAIVVMLVMAAVFSNTPVEHCFIREADETTGFLAENVKGSSEATAVIYEYADFQCEYCAMMNPYVNGAISVAEGNLAVVYRSYVAPYHRFGEKSAAAANAAAAQGYFAKFSDMLFSRQEEWAYGTEAKFNEYMEKYFEEVSEGKGDLARFNEDRESEAVLTKVRNETELAKKAKLNGTPAFYYENQLIDFSNQKGGTIKVGEEKLSFDHALSGDEFAQLLLDIVNIKINWAS